MIKVVKKFYFKKATFNKILKNEIKNNGVINVHRYDITNTGDLFCAPHNYFDQLQNKHSDIHLYKKSDKKNRIKLEKEMTDRSLIIGGGGLLNISYFSNQMKFYQKLAENGKKTVLWGLGHNEKDPRSWGNVKSYNIDVNKFGLVGTRDYSMPGEWLPCVSCLHELFDKKYVSTREVGVVFHKKTLQKPEIIEKFKDYPCTSNTVDLKSLIEFIGTSDSIVTDSYHGMYWSMLLGKKVVAIPSSSKFYDFKYKTPISQFDNAINDLKKASVVDGLLEECKELNINFAKRAFNYLEI